MHPALLDACFQSVTAHPAIKDVSDGGLLLPLGVRRLRSYGPARNARYCFARVTADERVGRRGRSRRAGRVRDGSADRAGLPDGQPVPARAANASVCWPNGC